MQRTKPPFRADHVGSLLRPTALKQARERCAKGEITAAALKEIGDLRPPGEDADRQGRLSHA